MPPNAPTDPPSCPRCGYDLAGQVDAWTDRCPIEGRCPECGLALVWGELLNPDRSVPRWSFEHRPSRVMRSWGPAFFAFLRPWKAWRELRLEHEVRAIRLLTFALALAFATHALLAAAAVARQARFERMIAQNLGPWEISWTTAIGRSWRNLLFPYADLDLTWLRLGATGGAIPPGSSTIAGVVAIVTPALMCFVLVETMSRARVRPGHVLRGLIGTLPGVALIVTIVVGGAAAFADLWGWQDIAWYAAPGVAIWTISAWYFIYSRYLRLDHAWLVWVVNSCIAVLAALTVLSLIDPYWLGWLII